MNLDEDIKAHKGSGEEDKIMRSTMLKSDEVRIVRPQDETISNPISRSFVTSRITQWDNRRGKEKEVSRGSEKERKRALRKTERRKRETRKKNQKRGKRVNDLLY